MKPIAILALTLASSAGFSGLVCVATPFVGTLLGKGAWQPGARLVGGYAGERDSSLDLFEDGTFCLTRGVGADLRTEVGTWSESGGQLRLRSEAGDQRILVVEEEQGLRLVDDGESFVNLKSLIVFDCYGR